ncbi:Hypothetical protein POVN_LOCUS579 [uncultured virus]|nr:Hypothetical protein POVN_LOCUS579 [uncultured virus]
MASLITPANLYKAGEVAYKVYTWVGTVKTAYDWYVWVFPTKPRKPKKPPVFDEPFVVIHEEEYECDHLEPTKLELPSV